MKIFLTRLTTYRHSTAEKPSYQSLSASHRVTAWHPLEMSHRPARPEPTSQSPPPLASATPLNQRARRNASVLADKGFQNEASVNIKYTKSNLSHNSPTWKGLVERYGKIARVLADTEDDPDKNSTEEFSSLYEDFGLKDITFDHDGFEFFQKKFAESIQIDGFRVKLELIDFRIVIRVRAQRPHEAAKETLHMGIFVWLYNQGIGDLRALIPIGSSGTLSCNLIDLMNRIHL
jgi:hypothetical protein